MDTKVEKGEKTDDCGEYNPFEHRNVKKPNSDLRSLANLIKSSLGSGLLAMPLAFSKAGWGLGIVGTIIITFVCAHCVHIFVTTSRGCCRIARRPLLGYAETCKVTFENGPKRLQPFAKYAWLFAEFALFFTYLGVACIFTVLISESVKQIIDRYYPAVILPVEYYCLILLVPLILLVQIRHLKWLAPFSLLANILLITTFVICLYYIFKDGISFENRRVVGSPSKFPAFLSTVIFAIEGIGVVMPVENSMKKPQHFLGCPGVLVIAMIFIVSLYTILGLFGYLKYGDELQASIPLNLPIDDWPAICAKSFIALSIFFTYPLHFFVVTDIFTRYGEPLVRKEHRNIFQIVGRTFLVCFCGGIGIALPLLGQIIDLVGAFFYSILGLIIPGIIETVFHWQDLGKFNWLLWKNGLIVLFGLFSLLSGCTVTVLDIIRIQSGETK